jgi:tripartite-type tricarboxylate transporter receptor subunit TctC
MTGTQRSSSLPDVPTVNEGGYVQLGSTDWYGVFVPAKTPVETVNKLNSAVREALGQHGACGLARPRAAAIQRGRTL